MQRCTWSLDSNKNSKNMGSKRGSLDPKEEFPFLPPVDHYIVVPSQRKGSTEQVAFDIDEQSHNQNGHGEVTKVQDETLASETKERKGCSNYTGIFLALFAGFAFTLGTVPVKYMKDYHAFTLAVYRLQGIFIPSIIMVIYARGVKKTPIFEPIWPITDPAKAKKCFGVLTLRAAVGCGALFFHFHALHYLTIADVSVVHACKPICVTIAAFLILGEAMGFFPVLMALLTMVGVGVITRPPMLTGAESFDENTLIGTAFALGSVLTDTMVVIIIRHLRDIHVSVMMLFLGCWGSIQSIACAYFIDELKLPQSGEAWLLAIAIAAVALVNQVAMNIALQFEVAATISLTRTMDFIFAYLLQFLIMSVVPDIFSVSGASIIIACVLLTGFRKWLTTLPKTHVKRKQFSFLLI